MEIGDIIIIGFSILYAIFLYSFSKGRIVKVERRLYFLFCVPLLAAALHIAKTDIDICLLGLYIGAFLPATCFFFEDTRWHKRLCIAAAFCTGLTVIPCIFYSGYRNPLYSEEFKEGVQMMRKYYVLSEYKGIDWDSLYDKYLVLFQEADTAKDLNAAFEAWQDFTMEFNDAHVSSYLTDVDDNHRRKYMEKHIGYDYGFCMVTLEDGRTVFANVDKDGEAYAVGIRDGMTVLSFDSKDIDILKQDGDMWFSVFPDKENEAFFQSLAVTSSGAETVKVAYLDKSGREQTVEVAGQGSNYERFRKTINQMLGVTEQTNLSYKMVNDDTACLVINDMSLNPMVRYASAFETDEDEKYGGLKSRMKDQVKKMKEEGAKKLIIDLRSNTGGYLEMSMALASLFTDKKYFAAAEGTYGSSKGDYEIVDSVYIEPDNVWGDGEIVILVNADTASAAEIFAYFMGKLENVTIMGMTKSTGSAMMSNSYGLERFELSFPVMLILDENSDVLIDSDISGISNMPLDVRIPMDEEAFTSIFEENIDYVLDYAVKYMENQ